MARRWFGRNRPAPAFFGGIRIRLFGMILLVALPLMSAVGVSLYRERQASIETPNAEAGRNDRIRGDGQLQACLLAPHPPQCSRSFLIVRLRLYPDA